MLLNQNFVQKKFSTILSIIVIIFLFCISLYVRRETFLNEPIGKNFFNVKYQQHTNTEVFIQSLFVFNIYRSEPISEHKFLSYYGGGIYTSFSPAVFIAPYITASILQIIPDSGFLQIFNLSLQLIGAILVYFLIIAFLEDGSKKNSIIAILLSSVYIFNTNGLHNQMNVYWAHQLAQPFYLLFLYLFVQKRGRIRMLNLFILTILLPYIFWTGYLINFAFCIFFIVSYLKNRRLREDFIRAIMILLSSILVFSLNTLHFLTKISFFEYIQGLIQRASARGLSPPEYHFNNWIDRETFVIFLIKRFIRLLGYDYGFYVCLGIFLFLCISFLIIFSQYFSIKKNIKKFSFQIITISLTLIPLSESVFLMTHDVTYGFGRLKFIVPIILILALFSTILTEYNKKWLIFLILLFSLANYQHTFLYHQIHNKKNFPFYEGQGIKMFDDILQNSYSLKYIFKA